MSEDSIGMVIDRSENNPLTKQEIELYKNCGWELSYFEPRISFVPTQTETIFGLTARYVFWKKSE